MASDYGLHSFHEICRYLYRKKIEISQQVTLNDERNNPIYIDRRVQKGIKWVN